jgi:hypothetical protein
MLTPVYGWFTEGFDTRDLQQPQPSPPMPEPLEQLTAKVNLVAEAQRPNGMPSKGSTQPMPASGRPSLFNAVTGAFRRRILAPPVAPGTTQQMRREPTMDNPQHHASPPVSSQQTPAAERTELEIPAFLRRQHK